MIHQRTYYMKLKKDPQGGSAPVPYLTPSGPDMDFKIRRTQFASPDLWKLAMKQPQGIKAKKKKNQTTNVFGETIGRLHLDKQVSACIHVVSFQNTPKSTYSTDSFLRISTIEAVRSPRL